MTDIYTKSKLVAELAAAASVTKSDVIKVLDQFTQVAYREAANGFIIPGICKLKVVAKKACKRRNPITGQILLFSERRALKIVPLKKAKDIIAPNIGVTVTVLDAPPPVTSGVIDANAPIPATSLPVPPQKNSTITPQQPQPVESEDGQIVFSCPNCSSILSAPPKSAGETSECPFCKGTIVVPIRQADTQPERQPVAGASPDQGVTDFILFTCRACGQQIEAPVDMVGMDVECPTCATGLVVPISEVESVNQPDKPDIEDSQEPAVNRSSMTIRIDLSDLQ